MHDRPTARIARPHTTTATITRMSLGARAHRKSARSVVAACVVAAPVAAMTARRGRLEEVRRDETTTTTTTISTREEERATRGRTRDAPGRD